MVYAWCLTIKKGLRLYSKCPTKYKDGVAELFRQDVENGTMTEEEVAELLAK